MSWFSLYIRLLVLAAAAIASATADAREGVSMALGLMALTNSTSQGGEGTKGSTLLTQTDVTYHGGYWGAGLFAQYDKQGDSETDLAFGPRVEASFDPFYLEFNYAVRMNRSFTDRAIAEQTGKAYSLGVGSRFGIGTGRAFMQFAYIYRTQLVTEQDGEALDEPIKQVDGYPLFGIGLSLGGGASASTK